MTFLELPNVLDAYPSYYDYIHSIELREDGRIQLRDGAGQMLIALARGKYALNMLDNATAELEIVNLAEYEAYLDLAKLGDPRNLTDEELTEYIENGPREKLRDLADLRVRVRKETGLYPFACETVWRVPVEDDWPCKLFKERYIFEVDPLDFSAELAAGNLYHTLEKKDFTSQAHVYYSRTDGQSLTRKELVELGVPLELFWEAKAQR